jgi:hypothetical protein
MPPENLTGHSKAWQPEPIFVSRLKKKPAALRAAGDRFRG